MRSGQWRMRLFKAKGKAFTPVSKKTPFLGFNYLCTAPESDVLRDHEAEYRAAETQELARLKRARTISSRENLVNGILSGDYQRYLER